MENDTEKQILNELKNINQSLQEFNKQNNDKKLSSLLYDVIQSLLIGFLIVGPALAVVMVIFQYIIG
ncbi:hypothetical protein GCM10007063_26070 [Lentibacillus kapialis]|uniref:Uncharacterized protein n=1 Tax=Lentibacillus kapialis TaxID=340214 RepID=A0A917Q0I5_9BACI|nr:hypothetical protein [Lentibacillus kapialis]GGK02546.1 hypothetical protein GCM10007063_26070 [Lentibacillus kapialis]